MLADSLGRRFFYGVFFLGTICSVLSCSSEKVVKDRIINEMHHKKGGEISIDLNKFTKEKFLRVCIQSPYLTKRAMEERVGAEIDDFHEVDDKFFILWVFRDQKMPMRLKFDRWNELNFLERSKGCVRTSLIKIIDSQIYLDGEY